MTVLITIAFLISLIYLAVQSHKRSQRKLPDFLFDPGDEKERKSFHTFRIIHNLSILAYVLIVGVSPVLYKLINETDRYEQGTYLFRIVIITVPFLVLFLISLIVHLRSSLVIAAILATGFDAFISQHFLFHSYGALGDGLIGLATPVVILFLILIGVGLGVVLWFITDFRDKRKTGKNKDR